MPSAPAEPDKAAEDPLSFEAPPASAEPSSAAPEKESAVNTEAPPPEPSKAPETGKMTVHRPNPSPGRPQPMQRPAPQKPAAPPEPQMQRIQASSLQSAPQPKSQPTRSEDAPPRQAENQTPPNPPPTAAEARESAAAQALVWRRCGYPAAHCATTEGKVFFGAQKNVLDATDGEYIYLAVPESLAEYGPEQEEYFTAKENIMGETHLICKLKDGRIV